MDKHTLSNYGWIVIVCLVLSIMLALATPFGTYVGDAVVGVANGFVGTNNNALDEENINDAESKWDDKFNQQTGEKPDKEEDDGGGSGGNEQVSCSHTNTEKVGIVEASCKQAGYTGNTKCKDCGTVIIYGTTVPQLAHTTELQNQKEASCSETGYTGDTVCTVCNTITNKGTTIPKSEHGELTTVNQKNAGCTTEGYTGDKVCSVCEEVVTRGETIGALGHTEQTVAGKEATCTTTGLTAGKKCSVCGITLEAQTVIPNNPNNHTGTLVNGGTINVHQKYSCCQITANANHSYTNKVTTASTCTKEGVRTYTCSCGYSYTEAISKANHTETTIPAVAATCKTTGLTAGTKCSVCNAILTAQSVTPIDSFNHEGETICVTYDVTNHYTMWECCNSVTAVSYYCNPTFVITKQPDCENTGIETVTYDCGYSYTNEVPANGHGFISIPAVIPTCTTSGSEEGWYCGTCNKRWEGTVIPATGHQHTELQGVIEATCYQTGYTGDTVCTDCGTVIETGTTIAKTNTHKDTTLSGAFDATCTTKGYTGDTICNDCGEIVEYGSEIPELGHIDANDDNKCDRCGADVIPEGGEYKQGEDVYTGGDSFPETTQADDTYTYGNYTYTYFNAYMGHTTHRGWKVKCNVNIADPGPMLESVNGLPVTSLLSTFSGCTNLTVIPEIPSTIKIMVDTYKGCTSITMPPELPSYLAWSSGMFEGCTNLTTAPILPNGCDFADMFSGCTSLKTYVGSKDADGDFTNYVIPELTTYIFIEGMFKDCEKMVLPPSIPDYANNIYSMFSGCKSLTTAPKLPSSVTNINSLFNDCKSLKTYVGSNDSIGDFTNYVIPSTVSGRVYNTFYNCEAMVKAPKMSQCTSITELERVFYSCGNLTTVPDLPTNIQILDATFQLCSKLKNIPSDLSVYTKLTDMQEAFYGTAITTVTALPSGIKNLYSAFLNCQYLTHIPVIPDSATKIEYCFYECKALKTYTGNVDGDYNFENYRIPNSVTSMSGFMSRTPIVTAPTIPENITDISFAFDRCNSLKYITINGNPTTYTQCFRGAPLVEIYGTCTIKDTLMAIAN